MQYQYNAPVFSLPRKIFLGFEKFACINNQENKKSIYEFQIDDSKKILLPERQINYYDKQKISERIYSYTIKNLSYNRFTFIHDTIKDYDILADASIVTCNELNNNGRLIKSFTRTYNGLAPNANNWTHQKTTTYSYNTITLNGYQKKTVPTQILTTQQFGSTGIIIADTLTYNYSGAGRLSWQRQGNIDGSITITYGNYTTTGLYREKTVSATGLSRKEYYEYDNNTHRFVTKIKNHLLYEATMTYDAKTGNKLSETDINGLTITYKYDNFGRLTQINHPGGTQTNISTGWFSDSHLPNARYTVTTTSTGKPILKVYYDILGREICRLDDGNYFETRYNIKGQVVQTSYPFGAFNAPDIVWHYYTYDNFGRISTETAPYVNLSYNYPNNSRRVTITDHLRGDISSYKDYDALGRVIQAKDEGGTINYAYSMITSNGKPRQQISLSTNGATTTILSDLWGNRLQITEPNAGTITSEYNKFNELVKQTDANNNITTYQYDVLGRVMQKHITGSAASPRTTEYIYDDLSSIGRIHQIIVNNVVEETFIYDHLSRLHEFKKVIDNTPYTFYYDYTPNGQLEKLTYPDNFAVTYSYNATGKLSEIRNFSDNSLIYKVSSRDNKYNVPIRCEYGNGVVTDYAYNAYGLLTRIQTGNKITSTPVGNDDRSPFISEPAYTVDSAILNYRYIYNNKGLMISRSESVINRLETYGYDNLDRLTEVKSGAVGPGTMQTQAFYYNNNGNISSSNVGIYTYGSKPHAVTRIEPTINHNIISNNQCDVTYNFFNQPTLITEGTHEILLSYGSNQQRNKMVKKIGNQERNTRYYINKFYEKENDIVTGLRHFYYIYGDNGIVALHIVNETAATDSMYYVHTDHLGSYCAITNAKKQTVQRNYFDPWGNFQLIHITIGSPGGIQMQVPINFALTDRGFTGHEHYPELKIINMNGRLYDPVIGRFFSPDKYVANSSFTQDFNRYTYARNNPLHYTDPSGEIIVPILLGIFIGAMINVVANINNIDGIGQGFLYALTGGLAGGLAGWAGPAVASALSVTGFLGGMAAGATAGAAAGFITGAGNTWIQGGSFGQGLFAGLKSGVIGSVIGGVTGGLIGGMEAWSNGASFWDGSFTHYDVAGTSNISYEQALEIAKSYNSSTTAEQNDAILNTLMQQEFGLESGGLANFSTKPGNGIGVDGDLKFIFSEKGKVFAANGYVSGVYGKSPYEMGISASLFNNITAFRATAGHEIIHALHYTSFAALGHFNNSTFSAFSEAAASNYSYNVYMSAGMYNNAAIYFKRGIAFPDSFRTLLHFFY